LHSDEGSVEEHILQRTHSSKSVEHDSLESDDGSVAASNHIKEELVSEEEEGSVAGSSDTSQFGFDVRRLEEEEETCREASIHQKSTYSGFIE
jgi:hypothetical protein